MKIKIKDLKNDEVVASLRIGNKIWVDDNIESICFKAINGGYIEKPKNGIIIVTQIVGTDKLQAYITEAELIIMNELMQNRDLYLYSSGNRR